MTFKEQEKRKLELYILYNKLELQEIIDTLYTNTFLEKLNFDNDSKLKYCDAISSIEGMLMNNYLKYKRDRYPIVRRIKIIKH